MRSMIAAVLVENGIDFESKNILKTAVEVGYVQNDCNFTAFPVVYREDKRMFDIGVIAFNAMTSEERKEVDGSYFNESVIDSYKWYTK